MVFSSRYKLFAHFIGWNQEGAGTMADQHRSIPEQGMSRRSFLRLVGMGSLGVLAAACASPVAPQPQGAAESAAAAEPKKVQFYTLVWQPGAVEAAQHAVETWNTANGSRITVEYIQGDWGKARDYLTTSIAGGVAPEVVHGITAWTNEYGQQGSYLALDDFIKSSDLGEDVYAAALNAAVSPIDQKTYGAPFCWEVGMMYINADRFTEQGVAIPEDTAKGWMWIDFHDAAKKVTKPPEYYGFAANLAGSQATEDIIAWMWQTGAEVMGEIGGKWQIDVEPAREALMLWHEMIHQDQIVSQDSFGGANIFEAFPLGTYSIMQTGCWARRIITEAQPEFQWRMVPLPYNKRHASSSEPQTWSLTANSRDRGTTEAGWEFIAYLMNQENQTAIALGDWLFPTRQSAMSDPAFNTTEHDWNLALKELEYGKPYPKHPAWAEFDERVMAPQIVRYLQDEAGLDEVIDIMVTEGTKLLQKYEQ
jgi:multiple sugar transport system substrate-binding protein